MSRLVDPAAAAEQDMASVVAFTRELIRIPSRGGIDEYQPVVEAVRGWMSGAGLEPCVLTDDAGGTVGLTCEVSGSVPGPRYVLDACLDTAPFGDEIAWRFPPDSAVVQDGWLYGRGAADSKVAASVFVHLLARLRQEAASLCGSVAVLLDVDEHTGGFGGIHAYVTSLDRTNAGIAGIFIGYPGPDHVVVGGRGVLRVWLTVSGPGGHSGATRRADSAVDKGADLVTALRALPLPASTDQGFSLPASVTVTRIEGGQTFSVVPDTCRVGVDVRLVPGFTQEAALEALGRVVSAVDKAWPRLPGTDLQVVTHWPPYRLDEAHPMVAALLDGARRVGLDPASKIAGPSNIGNYLAGRGIPATAGFGAVYAGLHATDERIRLDSVPAVQAAYHHALRTLLAGPAPQKPQ